MSTIRSYSVNIQASLGTFRGLPASLISGIELLRGFARRAGLTALAVGWSRARACLALPPAPNRAAACRNRDLETALLADPWRGRGAQKL